MNDFSKGGELWW